MLKMEEEIPDPEEDHPRLSIPKVLVQTGTIRPISNRSPQQLSGAVKRKPKAFTTYRIAIW